MSEATQTPTLEQTLNKTDFGHVLYENRKIFFGALIAGLLAVTGYVGWKQAKQKKALTNSETVFEFQSKTWSEAKAGKIAPTELVASFEKLDKDVQTAPIMVPVVLEMTKFLYEKGNYAEADTILSKVAGMSQHSVASFFIDMQRAVVLEKLGKIDEAIATLERLAQSKDGLMPARVSLELGRLYLTKGDKGKAQTQLDYVINTFPNDEQAKLAKLYRSKLAQ